MRSNQTNNLAKRISNKKSKSALTQDLIPKEPESRRPPIVTLMGHVDHGKTTLLDAIHKSRQIDKEHGGITQHIGAYQIDYQGRKITFIDTPGHAAFAKMRAHGARVTDLVVLVIAANDGIKPQTREALSHIRASNTPFLVAINKIDLPEADIERVKSQLAEEKVFVEDYGGKVVAVGISAKTGKNLSQLLEMIILLSDLLDLKADPKVEPEAVVIETSQDKNRGILVSLLVKNGTLRVGSEIIASNQRIKIKAMFDENGEPIQATPPGTPVEVLGFKSVPEIGEMIGNRTEPTVALHKPLETEESAFDKTPTEEPESAQEKEKQERKNFKLILKTDKTGSLEAITSNLSDEVQIVGQGIGEVTESDVLLAQATGATIYAFNTKIDKSAKRLAEIEHVEILTYNIIYKLFEDLEKKVLKLLEPTIDEEVLGRAEIVSEFNIKGEHIAGCSVRSGEIDRSFPVHLLRNEEVIADTRIKSLKAGKQDVEKVKKEKQCGMTFKPKIDFKPNDVIISYRIITN